MQQFPQVGTFMECVYQLVSLSIENYIERGFTHLLVNFGCTGGQHRSVYCAEMLAAYLSLTYTIHVEIKHTNQTNWIKN